MDGSLQTIALVRRLVESLVAEALAADVQKRKLVRSLVVDIERVTSSPGESAAPVTGHFSGGFLWDLTHITAQIGLPPLHLVIIDWDDYEGGADGSTVSGDKLTSGVDAIVLRPHIDAGYSKKIDAGGLQDEMMAGVRTLRKHGRSDKVSPSKFIETNGRAVVLAMRSVLRHELIHFVDMHRIGREKYEAGYRSAAANKHSYYTHGFELEAYTQQAIMDAEEQLAAGVKQKKILGRRPEDFVEWVEAWINKKFAKHVRRDQAKRFYRALAAARERMIASLEAP